MSGPCTALFGARPIGVPDSSRSTTSSSMVSVVCGMRASSSLRAIVRGPVRIVGSKLAAAPISRNNRKLERAGRDGHRSGMLEG